MSITPVGLVCVNNDMYYEVFKVFNFVTNIKHYDLNTSHFEIHHSGIKSDRKKWQQMILCPLMPGRIS